MKHYLSSNLLTGILLLLAAGNTLAGEIVQRFPTEAVLRDAAIDARKQCVYFAVYNRNEVWKVDISTRKTLASVSVGKGPSSLAISSDGHVLACVNRLEGTATLIDLSRFQVLDTISCARGACCVASLPGQFVVINSFSDSLTVIPCTDSPTPQNWKVPIGVPDGIAASQRFVVVIGRVPAGALVYKKDNLQTPYCTVSLCDVPLDVAMLDEDTFVIVSQKFLMLCDAVSGHIVKTVPIKDGVALSTSSQRIYVLAGSNLLIWDQALTPVREITLSPLQHISSITMCDGLLIATSPREHCWLMGGKLPAPPPIVMAVPPVRNEKKAQSIQSGGCRESTTENGGKKVVVSEERQKNKEVPASPANCESVLPSSYKESKGVKRGDVAASDMRNPKIPVVGTKKQKKKAAIRTSRYEPRNQEGENWKTLKHTPLSGMEVPAPGFTHQAPPPPGMEEGPQTITEAISQGVVVLGTDQGIQPPDWRHPFKNIQADHLKGKGSAAIEATGNVSFSLDTTHFRMDEFYYNEASGELRASGNISIVQDQAELTADSISYKIPQLEELSNSHRSQVPIQAYGETLSEQELAREAMTSGHVIAENLYILEPHRKLRAKHVDYDLRTRSGELDDARGMVLLNMRGQLVAFYFGAQKLHIHKGQQAEAENIWLSTSLHDPPNYRLNLKKASLGDDGAVTASRAQLQIGKWKLPVIWPKWAYAPGRGAQGYEFKTGHGADIGYYANMGYHFGVTPDLNLTLRLYPTTRAGVGFGLEGKYDFMKEPQSLFFRSHGSFKNMLTTRGDGETVWYHRHEITDNTVALVHWEQWYKRNFVKKFYYEDEYRNRTEPRTFVNVTHTKPNYIATATVRKTTNDFVAETERSPEVTFHLLERPIWDRVFFSFDNISGYNEREPKGTHATRSVNVARASLDIDFNQALSLTPFVELEGSWYSDRVDSSSSDGRFSSLVGATLQTRFHRSFKGFAGFSGFKHVIVPSLTYSYRPRPTMDVEETPHFDAYDTVFGRSRLEAKIDNVVFGQDEETKESWQVGRLSLFYGYDFSNEMSKSKDYELELDIRPRPWWGWLLAAEQHKTDNDFNIDQPYAFQRWWLEKFEDITGRPVNSETLFQYNADFGKYERVLSYLYYDDTVYSGRFNARLGFSYTSTRGRVFNREILYGAGYRFNEKWSFAFEHRYDFQRDDLYRQTYEIRRNFDGLEAAFKFRDRSSGWDVGFELSLVAFPGTKLSF